MARYKLNQAAQAERRSDLAAVSVRELPCRYEVRRAEAAKTAEAKQGKEMVLRKVSTRAACGHICETYALEKAPSDIVELMGAVWEICSGNTELFRTWSLVIDKKCHGRECSNPYESTHPFCALSKEGFIGYYLWKHTDAEIGWVHIEGTTQEPRLATSIDIDVERGLVTVSCPHREGYAELEGAVLDGNARRVAEAFGEKTA